MHRKHIRATVDGADEDIPLSVFVPLQFLYYNGAEVTTAELPANIVSGVPPTLDNAIVRWNGTSGTSIQNSLVLISDLAQVTGVTALNGRDIARWTDGPAGGSSTDNAVARWDATTGRLLQDSTVIIGDTGAITGVESINGTTWTGDYVRGPTPAVAADNHIATWDGISGRLIQDSGLHIGNVVYFLEAEAVTGHLPEFADSAGRRIIDSGIVSDHVVTSAAVGADNAVARYDGASRAIQTSSVSISDTGAITGVTTINTRDPALWVQGPASAVHNNIAAFNGTTGKLIFDSGVTFPLGGWVTGPSSATHNVIACFNGTSGKAIYQGGATVTLSGTTISNVTVIGSLVLSNAVTSPSTSVAFNLPRYADASGKIIQDSGIEAFSVARTPSGFSNDNRLVRTDTAAHASGVQQSGITVDDSNNISGVGTLNGSTASRLIAYTGAAAAPVVNEIACFDVSSAPFTVSYRPITISTGGAIAGVVTLNGVNPSSWVVGPASAADNAVARFDATTGKLIQSSIVTVSDTGVVAGVATVNGVTVETHAARHQPGGADPMFSSTSSAWAQMIPEWASSGGGSWLRRLMRAYLTAGGSSTGSYVSVMTNTTVSLTSGNVACCVALIPYSLSDTGLNVTVFSSWNNATTAAQVTCGNSGGRIASSGGTVVFGSTTPNGIPAVGTIMVVWPVTGTGTAQVGLAVAISGSGGTIHPGVFISFSGESQNA